MSTWPYRIAAITGASSGIGREMAIEVARRGSDVAVIARRRGELEETAAAVRQAGRRAHVAPCDVRDRDAVLESFREISSALGPVDLLIANAGLGLPISARKWDSRKVTEVLAVNVAGPAHAIEAVLPAMLERGSGRIVGISSLASFIGYPGHAAYAASKAAFSLMLETLRLELRSAGVGVTTICPGYIRTPMTAANRFKMPLLMDADDAARRIVDAIAARRRVYAFPWPLALAVRVARLLPAAVLDRLSGLGPRKS